MDHCQSLCSTSLDWQLHKQLTKFRTSKDFNQFLANCTDFTNIMLYVQPDSKKFQMSSMTRGSKSKMFGGCLARKPSIICLVACQPLLASLEKEASEYHEAQVYGLAEFVKYTFIATLLTMCDILPQ